MASTFKCRTWLCGCRMGRRPPPRTCSPLHSATGLFCNHENAVEVELDYREKIGSLKCRICEAVTDHTPQPPTNHPRTLRP